MFVHFFINNRELSKLTTSVLSGLASPMGSQLTEELPFLEEETEI